MRSGAGGFHLIKKGRGEKESGRPMGEVKDSSPSWLHPPTTTTSFLYDSTTPGLKFSETFHEHSA